MKTTSALEVYIHQLSPKAQQILTQLPDNAAHLVFDAVYGGASDDVSKQPADVRARVRRAVPVLDQLSDQQLDDVIAVATDPSLDVLDTVILSFFHNAGERGLTLGEMGVLVCEYVARSDNPELQRLADADPQFCAWREVKVPRKKETQ